MPRRQCRRQTLHHPRSSNIALPPLAVIEFGNLLELPLLDCPLSHHNRQIQSTQESIPLLER